ncbi:MAG: hypothetical protein ACI35R_04885 [Bacillus sp. (in: firmicutes)]
MNILTIIELDNSEVEEILDASFVFEEEALYENIVSTCVAGFQCRKTNKLLDSDEAMEQLFLRLKARHYIPEAIQDFSYELSSCERIRSNTQESDTWPKMVSISFTQCIQF